MNNMLVDGGQIYLHSLIKKYFRPELLLELDKISMMHDIDNNTKMLVMNEIMRNFNIELRGLGPGTNRYAILIEDYAVKLALDEDGHTDNKREFIYTKKVQPDAIRVYECMRSGMIAVTEYCEVLTEEEFHTQHVQELMRKKLKRLSDAGFLIGDIGIDAKNHKNWGWRLSNRDLIMLDFAYIYDVSYRNFQCSCPDQGMLYYNSDYTKLICPFCRRDYTFADVRRKISRKQEEKEIGDLRDRGYVVTQEHTTLPVDPRFTKIKKKKEVTDNLPPKKKKSKIVLPEGYIDPDEYIREQIEETKGE